MIKSRTHFVSTRRAVRKQIEPDATIETEVAIMRQVRSRSPLPGLFEQAAEKVDLQRSVQEHDPKRQF
jgi:hypothetical protein